MEKTVLIMGDSERDRLTYRRYLQADKAVDYYIIEAATSNQGLDLWRSHPPDVVVIDLCDDPGWELLKRMGQDYAEASLPVLALIDQQDEQSARQALKLGAMDYLVKNNLTAFSLCHRLEILCERRAAALAIQSADKTLVQKAQDWVDLQQQLKEAQEQLSLVEEELRERNLQLNSKWLRYQDLFNFAPDGYLVTNLQGKIQEANQSALDLLAVPDVSVLNQPLLTFVAPLDQTLFLNQLHQLQNHPQEQSWEMRLKGQGGEFFSVQITVIPHCDEKAIESHLRWFVRNISDRKRTEAALLESDRRFKTSFDHAAIGMSLSSLEGNLLMVNSAFCSIVGYTEAELLSLSVQDITVPEDLPADLDHTAQLLRGEIQSFNLEKRYRHKNGQIIWVLLTLSLVRDEQQQGAYFIAQIQDISDRKQAEAELRQLNEELENRVEQRTAALQKSEARLQESQKVARLGTWEYDVITGKIVWSPELFHIYGLNPHYPEPSYEEHLQNFPPPDRERLMQVVNRAIEQGESYDIDLEIIRADGTRGYIFAKGEASFNEVGQVVRLFGIAMDISDRKLVEQELSFSRDLQAVIFNESTDALFFVDPQTQQILDCNQRAVELFAAEDKTELLKIRGYRLKHHSFAPDELAEILEQMRSRGFWSRELEYRTLQGGCFWGNIAAKPIVVGERRMNFIRVTDISDRKQAEAQLQAINQQLAASNEDLRRVTRHKDEFLSIMSHELRTPLNAILGMTVSLKEQNYGAIAAQQQIALDTIESSGNHLLSLIDGILHLTDIESTRVPLHLLPTAISAVCQSSLRAVEPQAAQKHLQLLLKIAPQLPEFWLDELHVGQILFNLLNNAVKFTPRGGKITLEIDCERLSPPSMEPVTLRMSVRDTGIGIAAHHLDQLFQPFFQIDRDLGRQYEGIGLGLTLAQRIVESLEGTIAVTSQVGVGSCFTVEFLAKPHYRSSKTLLLSPSDLTPVVKEQTDPSSLLLLAEDSEANRFSISSYLLAQRKGYRFIFAKTGQEAIALTQSQLPDLIILNTQLPDLNGLEIIQHIKSDNALVEIPIIAIGDPATYEDRDRYFRIGVKDYILKPVSLKPLATKIQQLLP